MELVEVCLNVCVYFIFVSFGFFFLGEVEFREFRSYKRGDYLMYVIRSSRDWKFKFILVFVCLIILGCLLVEVFSEIFREV